LADRWEIAIELLKKFQGKGYGYHALVIMLDAFVNLTGEKVYRSRVDPDNYASQGLMKKIGAQPDGLSEMFIHGEELERYQEENKNLITDRLIEVAEDFCCDPIDLIGHVLEYRIEWGRTK
jgi:RimJ/RimL family protein N-acetyltransferase